MNKKLLAGVVIVMIFSVLLLVSLLIMHSNEMSYSNCMRKTITDDMNRYTINKQIELYKINTGYWPDFPNMENLLTNTSYFPDGIPRDPFTKESKLGIYTLDMRNAPDRMRVYSEPHTTDAGTHKCYCGPATCP